MSHQTHASITERFTWQPRSAFNLGLSAEELGVFCYLSNMATFKGLDMTTRAGKLKLLPGQLYSTIRQLGDQLKITKDKIARVLKKLSEMGLITLLKTATKAATHGTIVSVCHLTKFPPDGFDGETMSETKSRQGCDTNKKREKEEKEDSPYSPPEGGEDPMAGLEPQPQRAAGAGPSKSPPDPQPQAAPAGAGSPPNSAAPPSRAARASRMPDGWKPKEATYAWARNGSIGATDPQIAEQFEAFSDHHLSKGSKFVDWDRAFQTWMRNAKRFGHLAGEKKSPWQSAKEKEMSL